MGALEDEIGQLIEFNYGSKAAFARKIGLSEQTLYSVLKSNLIGASMATAMPIVAELDLNPFKLVNGVVAEMPHMKGSVEVPLCNPTSTRRLPASMPTDETFPIPTELYERYPHAFLLQMQDDSMSRILPDGCYALVSPCDAVDEPGQPYAVRIGANRVTIKRVKPLANGLKLIPDSEDPTYRPLVFDFADEDAEPVSILGRVVWFCPPADWRFDA